MSYAIAVIEDETTLAKNIKSYLERSGYDVRTAETGRKGIDLCQTFRPDIVLLDLYLPDLNGLDILTTLQKTHNPAKVIMMTAHGNVESAVQAMKQGASDYLSKPLVLTELRLLVEKIAKQTRMEQTLSYYSSRDATNSALANLIGDCPAIQSLKDQIQRLLVAEESIQGTPPAVLITGETGTGKELVARAIHYGSTRQANPFVEINCAAFPENLLESELFGYEPGAFTDAKTAKPGLFEAADSGTLFLDEIGDLQLSMQAKLLRVLEDKNIRRLGGIRDRQVDTRVIAATNRPPEELIREGKFRSDLYFRLRVVTLTVPPLRERKQDILLLTNHFLELNTNRYGKKGIHLSRDAETALLTYPWPGNVRELRHVVEQAVLLCQESVISAEQLPLLPSSALETPLPNPRFTLPPEGISLEKLEHQLVAEALERTDGNVTRAAKLLGLSRDTLRYRIDKYHSEPSSQQ